MVRSDGRSAAQQQVVGQATDIVRHLAINIGNFLQRAAVASRLAHTIQIQLAGYQVVAHLQHHHQHARQSLAARGFRCFQHHVARGLQLIGQSRLAFEQLTQPGGRIGVQIRCF